MAGLGLLTSHRFTVPTLVLTMAVGLGGLAPGQPLIADAAPVAASRGGLALLTDPFLQLPTARGVSVVWMTEFAGDSHLVLVGEGVAKLDRLPAAATRMVAPGTKVADGVRAYPARTSRLSRVAEDNSSNLPDATLPSETDGIVGRTVYRHEAEITGLVPGTRSPYRVWSTTARSSVASGTFTLRPAARPGDRQRILLTSDHQAMINTPANLELAAKTAGPIDAVLVAGDLVNVPDRASEWFDDDRGSAFFPVLQGHANRASSNGDVYRGAPIIQNAPIYPAIGNHEVQGRRAGMNALGRSYNAAVPRAVAQRAYAAVARKVNPTGDRAIRERWIQDHSFSTTTYEEIFSLPRSGSGGEKYYATTIGDVRVISLFSTRIWRGTTAQPKLAERTDSSRYQEAASTLREPLDQGWGEHIFERVDEGSRQLEWLANELASKEFAAAKLSIVMLHEGPQGLGDNVMPIFTDPVRIIERDASGKQTGVRYEYPPARNQLLNDLQPMLEKAGVDLVLNGHSHLWNRFAAGSGTQFLETSNTGNSYGAYHELSGRQRPLPPAPWNPANYLALGNPGGLAPIVPTVNPMRNADGTALPFVQSNDHAVFSVLDTGTGIVTSWSYDVRTPKVAPVVLDRFTIGGSAGLR